MEEYRDGKKGLMGFFMGQIMKETQGKADPKVVQELLRQELARGTRWSKARPFDGLRRRAKDDHS